MTPKLDKFVTELFEDHAGAIGEDTQFKECNGWDSLKHVELILGLEARFGVELTAAEIERLTCKRAAREILSARQVDD